MNRISDRGPTPLASTRKSLVFRRGFFNSIRQANRISLLRRINITFRASGKYHIERKRDISLGFFNASWIKKQDFAISKSLFFKRELNPAARRSRGSDRRRYQKRGYPDFPLLSFPWSGTDIRLYSPGSCQCHYSCHRKQWFRIRWIASL